MKFIKAVLSLGALLIAPTVLADDEALRDLQIGMQGLKEAANNPELLAQLMHDLQVSRIATGYIRVWRRR
jgi:uncharacterized membrane protein